MCLKNFSCACVKIFIFAAASLYHTANTQIAVYHLELGDLYKMQTGIGWPHVLNVSVGHEAQMRLATDLENQQSCYVLTPTGVSFNVQQPPSDRYERWSEGCGLRVKNVSPGDEGRWRLTAINAQNNITGWTELHVEAIINEYTASPIILHDGEAHPDLNLATLSSSYCLIQQPFSDRTLVSGQCHMSLDRATRAVQGNWHLWLGLPGRVAELAADRSVTVETERLDTGFVHGGGKLNLYCNLHHSEKNITFCRFQRSNGLAGYNIIDGLSDGEHSYYGDGFARRQCGMTVEYPSAGDYVSWRCTVGVQERVGTVIEQKPSLQALIRVTGPPNRAFVRTSRAHESTVFVQKGMTATLSCEADVTLSYCWFQHPNGTHFTPVPLIDDDQLFWYTGESLQVGECGITFTHMAEVDDGVWTCHMGPRDVRGVEITDTVHLRVTGPLAAREKEVQATIGGNITLYCHSSNGNRPLEYCRFLSPNYVGISIDETVTPSNAVLNRFYFTTGRAIDYGDCSVTISPVLAEDEGVWTCAALVDEEISESSDTIRVITATPQRRATASIIGMTIGVSLMLLVFGGVMLRKYINLPSLNIPWRRSNHTDTDNVIDNGDSTARTSFNSDVGRVDLRLGQTHELWAKSAQTEPVSARLSGGSNSSEEQDPTREIQTTQNVPNMIDLNKVV